jgi:MutS domain V
MIDRMKDDHRKTKDEPPADVYERRIAVSRGASTRLGRWDAAIAAARALTFVIAVVVAILVVRGRLEALWLTAPGAGFAVLVAVHGRVIDRRARLEATIELSQAGIERIADRWAGKGDAGENFRANAEGHLYAADLDIFGRGGLFELLSVARTPIGRATLAGWLQTSASAAIVRGRQKAVAELGPRVDLRQDLALVATKVEQEVREEALMTWAAHQPPGLPSFLDTWRWGLAFVGGATIAAAVLWASGVVGPWPAIAAFLVGGAMSRRLRKPVEQILAGLDRRSDELRTLSALLSRVERGTFDAAALLALRQTLETDGLAPSRRVAQLRRLVDTVESRRNQVAGLIMSSVQATAQLALAIETWRRTFGPAAVRWMTAVGELEALSSLATFHFERPSYPFPVIEDVGDDAQADSARATTSPRFESEGLGHPLIPAASRVVNDVVIAGEPRLILVSGSNMSGKSTLLRAVGVNAVLALSGAPVCARRLILSPLALGATLRINDSLQEGRSRFYAELLRLKQIVDRASGSPPVLFLLDEILHGTNSHDRRIGAEAIIRGLLERGAAGLVTTHDLALAEVADALGAQAANVHFDDHLEGGVMSFDYLMKPGIVRRSNALALLRAIGLDV